MLWYLIFFGVACFLATIYFLFLSPQSQVFGYFPFDIKTKEKVIALTFDDGPNEPFTSQLLEVLKKHNVKATFFLVGKNLEKAPDVGRAIAAGGHTIGNHSYAHVFSNYFNHQKYTDEVAHNQDVIESIVGKRPIFFRPPWLWRQPWLLKMIKQKNLTPISGVFGCEIEIFQPAADFIAWRAMQKLQPGTIIIFHDGYNASGANRKETVAAIDKIIPQIKARGYRFVTVDELLGIKQ